MTEQSITYLAFKNPTGLIQNQLNRPVSSQIIIAGYLSAWALLHQVFSRFAFSFERENFSVARVSVDSGRDISRIRILNREYPKPYPVSTILYLLYSALSAIYSHLSLCFAVATHKMLENRTEIGLMSRAYNELQGEKFVRFIVPGLLNPSEGVVYA